MELPLNMDFEIVDGDGGAAVVMDHASGDNVCDTSAVHIQFTLNWFKHVILFNILLALLRPQLRKEKMEA